MRCTSTLLAVFLMGPMLTGLAEDWPQWRGPDRSNRSAEKGLFESWDEDGPPLKWTAKGLGEGYAGVSVAEGRIYTTGNLPDSQAVVSIDETTGKVLWNQSITDKKPDHSYEGSRSTPTVDGERLYVVASDGKIVCLNTSDGQVVWTRDFSDWDGKMMSGWGYSESPLVDGDRVICTPGGPDAMMVALDKLTGDEIWTAGQQFAGGAGYASAVVSNGGGIRQYVQLVGKGLIGVRARDGQVLWQYERVANGTANIPTPLVSGNYVFTSTAYNTGSALLQLKPNGNGGVDAEEVYWLEANKLQVKHGGMVLVDGHIYAGHGNGNGLPICVEAATGEIQWGPVRAPGSGEAAVVYADGHVIFRREDGRVLLVRATPEAFDLVAEFTPEFQQGKSWAHPVIANGRMYLREQSKLMAYEL